VTPVSAKEAWPVEREASHEPAPYCYQPEHLRRLPADFLEKAEAVIVYMADVGLFQAEPDECLLGKEEWVHHRVIRCNRAAAFRGVGEFRDIRFTPRAESLTLNEAVVHKPDGRVLPVRPEHVRVRDVNTDFLVYSESKMVIVSFPNLEAGDVIEVKWTVRRAWRNAELAAFGRCISFGRLSPLDEEADNSRDCFPVARQVVRLCLPQLREDLRLRFAVAGGAVEYKVEEQASSRRHTWQATNYRAGSAPGPASEDKRLTLYCSMIPSWDTLGPSLRTQLKDCWECTPEIQRLVEEQTHRRPTATEKARALAEWVRNNVRFRSADHTSGIIPQTPAVTLFERCGDCKDACQLLAVMLRAADIQVGLTYLSTVGNGQIPEEVPHYWGNHVILHVTIDGREHWVDPTRETGAWDRLPREDADRICIVFEGEGVTLRRTPPRTTHLPIGPLTHPTDRHTRTQRRRQR
jgi:hypothetical protein